MVAGLHYNDIVCEYKSLKPSTPYPYSPNPPLPCAYSMYFYTLAIGLTNRFIFKSGEQPTILGPEPDRRSSHAKSTCRRARTFDFMFWCILWAKLTYASTDNSMFTCSVCSVCSVCSWAAAACRYTQCDPFLWPTNEVIFAYCPHFSGAVTHVLNRRPGSDVWGREWKGERGCKDCARKRRFHRIYWSIGIWDRCNRSGAMGIV